MLGWDLSILDVLLYLSDDYMGGCGHISVEISSGFSEVKISTSVGFLGLDE